jgi:hypothetical protein
MSEQTSERGWGGPRLSVVFPGLPQLLKGRWGVGGLGLMVWLGLLAVLLCRWARFAAGWGGPLDHQVASITVVAGLIGAWAWSMFDLSRPAGPLDRSPRSGDTSLAGDESIDRPGW